MKYKATQFTAEDLASGDVTLSAILEAWREAAPYLSGDLHGLVRELTVASVAFAEALAARHDTGLTDHQKTILLAVSIGHRLPVTRALLGYVERSVPAVELVPALFSAAAGLRAEAHLLLHHWADYSRALEASGSEEP